MNTTKTYMILFGLTAGILTTVIGQTVDPQEPPAAASGAQVEQAEPMPPATNQPVELVPVTKEQESGTEKKAEEKPTTETATAPKTPKKPAQVPEKPATETAVPPIEAVGDKLRLNFRNAPLELVLDYLSKAAGFTIVLETDVKGKVDVWSDQPLSKDEAVDLLDSMLNRNGYAAIRNDRTLTIVSRDDAKKRNIRVQSGNIPDAIPKTDEMVTQIIPVRYANATQLTKDLQPLLPSYANLTANESGNALVLTDVQSDVRRMVEIVHALDTSVSSILNVRIFHLANSDPVEMVNLFNTLFPEEGKTANDQNQSYGFRIYSRSGYVSSGSGGSPGGAAAEGSNDRMKKQGRVLAVADQRTGSLIISAAEDLMTQIAEMIEQIDSMPAKRQKVYVFSLENAEVTDVLPVLQDMFNKESTTSRSSSSSRGQQTNALTNRATRNSQQTGTSTTTTGRTTGISGGTPSGF